MQFPESWLREWCNPRDAASQPLATETLCEVLTMGGLEVESAAPLAPPFTGVCIARVLTVTQHPQADRLAVCQVEIAPGEPTVQIVCGAPNVRVGIRVPCARVGARLPGGLDIRAAKLRGVESQGMLCSAKELGVSEDGGGLWILNEAAPVGADLRSWAGLDQAIFTLKITPNRADCLSLRGVARELAALTGTPFSAALPPFPKIAPNVLETTEQTSRAIHPAIPDLPDISIQVAVPEACPRYSGRLIRGVNAAALTPAWMAERLQQCGLRPISALVDITNYVMLELGQPLHAFDAEQLAGSTIQVRWARPGERLVLLDGHTRELDETLLVIADAEKPVGLAGIMGGAHSAVAVQRDNGSSTHTVFLESAFFAPSAITGRARRWNLHTDAAYRYERGVDFGACTEGLERASALILAICGGEAAPIQQADAPTHFPPRPPLAFTQAQCTRLLGVDLAAEHIGTLLARLALSPQILAVTPAAVGLPSEKADTTIRIIPPSFRFDLTLAEDAIEEVARLHGYDAIPSRLPQGVQAMAAPNPERSRTARMKARLVSWDYQEIVSYAFVDARQEAHFSPWISPPADSTMLARHADAHPAAIAVPAPDRVASPSPLPIRLQNPIAGQMSVMRTTLIGGLVEALRHNIDRQHERVRLFEQARVFHGTEAHAQPEHWAWLAWGARAPEQWGQPAVPVDFYDLKAEVENLLTPLTLRFEPAHHPAFHPGRCAVITFADGTLAGRIPDGAPTGGVPTEATQTKGKPAANETTARLGYLGALHPRWVQHYGLRQAPLLVELCLPPARADHPAATQDCGHFPVVRRDLALVVDEAIPYYALLDALTHTAARDRLPIRQIVGFDLYRGSGVPIGKKSLAFKVILQHTAKTLSESEIEACIASLLSGVQSRIAATLRQ